MISLTSQDGSTITIDPSLVVRARRAVEGEFGEDTPDVKTRIDWALTSYVREPIDRVASLIRAELASFTFLTSRDGSKIWFDARQAVGPLPVTPTQAADGTKSLVKVRDFREFVIESPDDVRSVIRAGGGTPL